MRTTMCSTSSMVPVRWCAGIAIARLIDGGNIIVAAPTPSICNNVRRGRVIASPGADRITSRTRTMAYAHAKLPHRRWGARVTWRTPSARADALELCLLVGVVRDLLALVEALGLGEEVAGHARQRRIAGQ